MNKKIRAAVFERANGTCELCECRYATEFHHSIQGGSRRSCESIESGFALCSPCHTYVHSSNGHEANLKLKLITQQRYFDQGMTEDEVRAKVGGKLYQKE